MTDKPSGTVCRQHIAGKLPEGKGLWQVPHYGCGYPTDPCDCYCGINCEPVPAEQPRKVSDVVGILSGFGHTAVGKDPVAASPAEGPRQITPQSICRWCKQSLAEHSAAKHEFEAAAQPSPDAAKVGEIARRVVKNIRYEIEEKRMAHDSEYVIDAAVEALRPYFPEGPHLESSRTYGELPGSIRNMIEPHEWDNKNISEQRDYALDMVDFLERDHFQKWRQENFDKFLAAEAQLRTAREALQYVVDVRGIRCEHKHPGPDEICARCRIEAALSSPQSSGKGEDGKA